MVSDPKPTLLRRLINLDTALSLNLYTFFHPILPFPLLKSLELSGDGRLFFPIILSSLYLTTPISAPISAVSVLLLNLLIGSLLDILLICLIKPLVRRPRPVYNKHMFLSFSVDHWSFPSGHASRVFLIAAFCFLYSSQIREVFDVGSGGWVLEHFVGLVGLWAVITAASRVLLGRHFVLDVFAGACLGVIEGVLVFRLFNYDNLSLWVR